MAGQKSEVSLIQRTLLGYGLPRSWRRSLSLPRTSCPPRTSWWTAESLQRSKYGRFIYLHFFDDTQHIRGFHLQLIHKPENFFIKRRNYSSRRHNAPESLSDN